MAFPRVFGAPKIVIGATYLAAYALLDWLSFIEPYPPLGITPWNPGIGLSFVLLLMFGRRMIPFVIVAPLLAAIVQRQSSLPWSFEIASSVLVGAIYSLAALFLMRPSLRFEPALSSMRDLLLLMLVAAASAACVAVGYVGLTVLAGLFPVSDFAAAALRNWIGDVIGIIVVAPFSLLALTRPRLLTAVDGDRAATGGHRARARRRVRRGRGAAIPIVLRAVPARRLDGRARRPRRRQRRHPRHPARPDPRHPAFPRRHVQRDVVPGIDARARHDRARRRRARDRAAAHAVAIAANSRSSCRAWPGSAAWASSRPRSRTSSISR